MNHPRISVISIIYGVEPYLRQCLESLQSLTYPELELILVVGGKEDGSDDGCLSIAEDFAGRDNRFKIVRCIAAGAGDARNRGLDAATGEYIGFVDGDDYVEPDMFTRLYENLIEHDADISVCGKFSEYQDKTLKDPYDEGDPISVLNSEEAAEMLLAGKGFFFHSWDKLFKAELFSGIRFPTEGVLEDRYIIGNLILDSERIVYDRTPLYHFRVRTDSLSRTRGLCEENVIADTVFSEKVVKRYPALKDRAEACLLYGHITCVQNALAGDYYDRKSQEKHLDYIGEHGKIGNRNPYINMNTRVKVFLSLYSPGLLKLWTEHSLKKQAEEKGFGGTN